MEFQPFPKMARLTRECVITEKIDGTNAQVHIVDADEVSAPTTPLVMSSYIIAKKDGLCLFAGKRTSYCTPDDDNFGFAKWVKANADSLWALGAGRHYGEWWGSGIQRTYGLSEKRFSLFNVARWHAAGAEPYVSVGADPRQPPKSSTEAPACCGVVPVLYRGLFGPKHAENFIEKLRHEGSVAAPGFMNPEGVVVFHTASGTMFKKTLDKDEQPKGVAA
jgi:hypothetical protein